MEQHGQHGRRGGAARVAAILRDDIAYGRLRPGDRLPSTRQLVHAHGVAMATASRAVAMLRDEGLVVTRPGSGTTVRPLPTRPATARPSRGNARAEVVERAVAIADREGLHAVTMRRLAGELGMAPMSLYRHVAGREDLERLMLRAVFVASPLPSPPPESPRERLLGVYRLQWRLYRRHRWLATLTGVTRPPLVPEAMSHTERALGALADLGLPLAERGGVAIALTALVRGLALSVAEEVEAEHESRQRNGQWWSLVDPEITALLATGRFPQLAALAGAVPTTDADYLDDVVEASLTTLVDGLAGTDPHPEPSAP